MQKAVEESSFVFGNKEKSVTIQVCLNINVV